MTDHGTPPSAEDEAMGGQRFLLILSIVLITIAIAVAWPYRGPIVFALLLGYLLHSIYRWLKARVKYRPLAAGGVLTGVAVALVLPFVIVGVTVAEDVQRLADMLQQEDVGKRATEALTQLGVPEDQADQALSRMQGQVGSILEQGAVPLIMGITEFVIALVVFFILLYFVLVDGESLVDYLRRTLPLDAKRRDRLLQRIGERVDAIMLGTLLVSVIQGFAAALAWWLLGFPQPVFWGFVMTLLAVIPFLGPFIVLLPAGALWALQGKVFAGVALIIWGIVLVGLIDDVLRPYVIGRRSDVHPAIILVGILGGIVFFGITGFILGPLLLSLLGPVFEAWSHPEDHPLETPEEVEADGEEESDGGNDDGEGPPR